MKNLVFGLIAIFMVSISAFASNGIVNPTNLKSLELKETQIFFEFSINNNDLLQGSMLMTHTCNYNMYNANGQFLGQWSISNVPDNVSCGSSQATNYAIQSYNGFHEMFP
jgi:hypothetical protein